MTGGVVALIPVVRSGGLASGLGAPPTGARRRQQPWTPALRPFSRPRRPSRTLARWRANPVWSISGRPGAPLPGGNARDSAWPAGPIVQFVGIAADQGQQRQSILGKIRDLNYPIAVAGGDGATGLMAKLG